MLVSMAGRPIKRLILTPSDQRELQRIADGSNPRSSERAKIILHRADGFSQIETAKKLGCSSVRVSKWTERFRKLGLIGLNDTPGRGRKPNSASRKSIREPGNPLDDPQEIKSAGPQSSIIDDEIQEPDNEESANDSPTMRTIAQATGVSTMTVSRALNNRPEVRPDVRKQVWDAAKKIGYRPDPQLRRLTTYLRKRKILRLQGNICCLKSKCDNPTANAYYLKIISSARAKARSLGFAWESLPMEAFLENPHHVFRVLHHRGVEGIFLPPIDSHRHAPLQIPANAEWDRFSVIATSFSVSLPTLHRVVPDQFKNMTLICDSLANRGYRRIGLTLPKYSERKVRYHYSGGFSAYHLAEDREMIPIYYYDKVADDPGLIEWYQREKPDAIIISYGDAAPVIARRLGLPFPGPVAFAALTSPESIAGIDERPEEVGSMAMELLSGMIVHQEKGLGTRPTVTMVEGIWKEGASAPFRKT